MSYGNEGTNSDSSYEPTANEEEDSDLYGPRNEMLNNNNNNNNNFVREEEDEEEDALGYNRFGPVAGGGRRGHRAPLGQDTSDSEEEAGYQHRRRRGGHAPSSEDDEEDCDSCKI